MTDGEDEEESHGEGGEEEERGGEDEAQGDADGAGRVPHATKVRLPMLRGGVRGTVRRALEEAANSGGG